MTKWNEKATKQLNFLLQMVYDISWLCTDGFLFECHIYDMEDGTNWISVLNHIKLFYNSQWNISA